MRKIKAFILSGILVLGGLSWLAGPTSAYAAPLASQGQTQQVEREFFWTQIARWFVEAAVKAAGAYAGYKAAQAILNGQGPGNDLITVPEEVF